MTTTWEHYDESFETKKIEQLQFDALAGREIGNSYKHKDEDVLDYEGVGICGNFMVKLYWIETEKTKTVLFKDLRGEPEEIFPLEDETCEYIKIQETNPKLLATEAFAVKNFCSKCRKHFVTKNGLSNHVEKNTCKFKSFKCSCGKWFTSERGLNMHVKKIDHQHLSSDLILLGVHSTQLRIAKDEERNFLNSISFECPCDAVFHSEVALKKHLTKCSQRKHAPKLLKIEAGDITKFTRKIGAARRFEYIYLEQDEGLLDYLLNNGERPTEIKGDERLLGYRYIGKRDSKLDVKSVLTEEEYTKELRFRRCYKLNFESAKII